MKLKKFYKKALNESLGLHKVQQKLKKKNGFDGLEMNQFFNRF